MTDIPDTFFSQVLPKIQDIVELKVTLYIFQLLNQKRDRSSDLRQTSEDGGVGIPFLTYGELSSYITSIDEIGEEAIRGALSSAVSHGAISKTALDAGGNLEEAYSASAGFSPTDTIPRHAGAKPTPRPPARESIFALYEQNIGMITPMIAEELKEAEKLYPEQWIKQAFKEAVVMNKRSWRYISRILERWASEGKQNGEHRQDLKKGGPDKYTKGKYGHLVQR